MNNKGQSLVLFILVIPILLGIIVLVIDVGNALVVWNKTDNIIEMVMEYGLEDDYDLEELEKLVDYNIDGDSDITIIDDKIKIKVSVYTSGIMSNIFEIDGFKIVSNYIGYMENDKKVIEKVRE